MGVRAFHEYYGQARPEAPKRTSILQPNRRNPARRDAQPPASRRRTRKQADAPPRDDPTQQGINTSQQAQEDDSTHFETYLDEEAIPPAELEALKTLADNSREEWPKLHSWLIEHNLVETITHATQFTNNAMVGYFTDHPPLLLDFKIWVREEWLAGLAHPISGEKILPYQIQRPSG